MRRLWRHIFMIGTNLPASLPTASIGVISSYMFTAYISWTTVSELPDGVHLLGVPRQDSAAIRLSVQAPRRFLGHDIVPARHPAPRMAKNKNRLPLWSCIWAQFPFTLIHPLNQFNHAFSSNPRVPPRFLQYQHKPKSRHLYSGRVLLPTEPDHQQ